MANRNGWPLWSNKEGIASMDDNYIRNTIALIERKWDDLDDEDDILVADHWSLTQTVFQPGKPWYKERLKELRTELSQRLAETASHTEPSKNAKTSPQRGIERK